MRFREPWRREAWTVTTTLREPRQSMSRRGGGVNNGNRRSSHEAFGGAKCAKNKSAVSRSGSFLFLTSAEVGRLAARLGWRALACVRCCLGVPCAFRWYRGVLSVCGVVLPLLLLLPAGPAPSCCSWLCSCCRCLLHSCLGSCLCFPFGPQSCESALRTAAHGLKSVSPFLSGLPFQV